MYSSQKSADIVKKLLIDKKTTAKKMCEECNLGVNSISNIRRGDIKSVETFMTIADYLDCSVDYLLGRTDNPEVNRSAKKHTLAEYSEIAALGGSMTRDALIDDDFDTTLPEK